MVMRQDFRQILHRVLPLLYFGVLGGFYLLLVYNKIMRYFCIKPFTFTLVSVLFFGALGLNVFVWKRAEQVPLWGKLRSLPGMGLPVLLAVPACAFLIGELVWNTAFYAIAPKYMLVNYQLFLALELALLLILRNRFVGYTAVLLAGWGFGVVNYYVLLLRGSPLTPSDFFVIGTAATVAGSYDFSQLTSGFALGTIGLLYTLPVVRFFTRGERRPVSLLRRMWDMFSGGVVLYLLCAVLLNGQFYQKLAVDINQWQPELSIQAQGAPLSFGKMVEAMQLKAPEGYSEEAVEQLLAPYHEDVTDAVDLEKAPSVIIIMNESWSDLSVLGELETDPYMEGVSNLEGVLQKGYVYSSVHGATTCNAEYEFLTGNSMTHLSNSIYPYRFYNLAGNFSVPAKFKELGYDTGALHPCYPTNWNRPTVYKAFRIDRFVSNEDMEEEDYTIVNWNISDRSNYKYLIEMYEARTNPLFLFNITMQNHAGYAEEIPSQIPVINAGGLAAEYQDVVYCLSLMKETEAAFMELIEYFKQQDDPVIVCMFGDHQPAVSAEFYQRLLGDNPDLATLQKKYQVPYVIWSNFTATETVEKNLSMNYLGGDIMRHAGVRDVYTNYLLDLQKRLPVVSAIGYQTADGAWHTPETPHEALTEYRYVQYYQMTRNQ